MYLSKLLPSNIQNKSEQFIFIYILDILQNHFIPHITENLEIKAHYLGYMVKEILDCYLGISEETDKDSYIYKRVDLSGFLVGTIFRDLYFRYRNNIEHTLNKEYARFTEFQNQNDENINTAISINTLINKNNLSIIFSSEWMNDGFKFAFKNAWGLKGAPGNKLGIVQDLNRLSFLGTVSHLRRLNNPLPKGSKIRKPHSLHSSSWGVICPIETPDGGNVGIRKNLSLMAHVTFGSNSKPIFKCLRLFGMKLFEEVGVQRIHKLSKIFLNERLIGLHEYPKELTDLLRNLRRNMLINIYTSVSWYTFDNIIKITTDSGRSCRPLMIVSKLKKLAVEKENLKDLQSILKKNYQSNWYRLLGHHDKELSSQKKNTTHNLNYDSTYYHPDKLVSKIVNPTGN